MVPIAWLAEIGIKLQVLHSIDIPRDLEHVYPSLVDKLSGLWVQISAKEVVLSKTQLDRELTADPEGDRIFCVILYDCTV